MNTPDRTTTRSLGAGATEQMEPLRAALRANADAERPKHCQAEPDDVAKSVIKLVLTLVEFVRQLLERQALRQMEHGTLSDAEIEDIGLSLACLEQTIRDLAVQFELSPEELNLDLGPLGDCSDVFRRASCEAFNRATPLSTKSHRISAGRRGP